MELRLVNSLKNSSKKGIKLENCKIISNCFLYMLLQLLLLNTSGSNLKAQHASSNNYEFAEKVNTRIGNEGRSTNPDKPYHEAGFTYPGATYPFGMVQFTPTFFNKNKGFVINQMSGAGCEHMGNLPTLAINGAIQEAPNDMQKYNPDYEIKNAYAGFYEADMFDNIRTRLTATKRTGMAEFTFNANDNMGTIFIGTGINATSLSRAKVRIISPNRIEGSADGGSFCGSKSNYTVYYVAEFDTMASKFGTWKGDKLKSNRSATGENSGAFFTFDVAKNETISYKVGISYVSIENARENLKTENPGWNFHQRKEQTVKAWNNYLGRIEVEGKSKDRTIQFYSNLYHALMHPSLFSDVNGEYIGADMKIHNTDGSDYYTAFSNWDTYRTQIPLLSMLFPSVAEDVVSSHLKFAQQSGGSFPRWVLANYETGIMQGDPTSVLVANAYAYGAKDFDKNLALSIMRKGAEQPGSKSQDKLTRPGLANYLENGYTDKASITLEYISSDFAIGQFALQALEDQSLYQKYMTRSKNWEKLYNPETTWLQSKNADGSWRNQGIGWREATYKDYFWMIPHDLRGLINTLGSDEVAENRLDHYFRKLDADYNQKWYAAGNEPSFHTPWIYNWTGSPNKTQKLVRRIIREQFSSAESGLPGNDDLGTMGAWYVFANMGMYPMIPGYGGFTINSPSFKKIDIKLGSGNTISIYGGSHSKPYITDLKINNQKWTSTWIPYGKLYDGAILNFSLSKNPDTLWGVHEKPPNHFLK